MTNKLQREPHHTDEEYTRLAAEKKTADLAARAAKRAARYERQIERLKNFKRHFSRLKDFTLPLDQSKIAKAEAKRARKSAKLAATWQGDTE